MEVFQKNYNNSMKKILILLFLATLILSQQACASTSSCQCAGGSCGTGSSCSSCGCSPSFPVNQQVCIQTPTTVAPPACAIPNVPPPSVCPPPVCIPTITPPTINTCILTPPPVVCPPTVTPPTPVIPVVCPPNITPPPPPPQVPPIGCPPVLPPAPCVAVPPAPGSCGCQDKQLSNLFTLSFQYACRSGVALASCLANVLWNNKIIQSIVPVDNSLHTFSLQLTAVAGANTLQIEGAGISDSYGLIIDNVKLIRQGDTANIVVNGDFQQPNVGSGWGIFANIPGWTGVGIEVGWGQIYNAFWSSQTVELDGNSNYQITQTFHFDSFFNLKTPLPSGPNSFNGQTLTYTLEFDYAARSVGTSSPFTSQADILWNNVVVASLYPGDYLVHHFSLQVALKAGENLLYFDGASHSDGYGLIISNVKLASAYNGTNLISNGNFASPNLGGGWNYLGNGIPSWTVIQGEIGNCRNIYNGNWPSASAQCIELDSDSNQRYIYSLTISQLYFTNLYVYIQQQQGNSNANNNLLCETQEVIQHTANAIATIQGGIQCKINMKRCDFSKYLQQLFGCVGETVQNLHDDDELTINQYDYLTHTYIQQFGQSYEPDFTDDDFDTTSLQSWVGFIDSISGKVINCHDQHGHHHHIQIAPCSHFEGQYPLPVIGQKIYWTGAQQPCGKTYVKWATTCNC